MNEYIITDEQLKQIRELIFHEDEIKFEKLSWKIISRPHPAPYQCGDEPPEWCSLENDL